jgi:hypothetical protein
MHGEREEVSGVTLPHGDQKAWKMLGQRRLLFTPPAKKKRAGMARTPLRA